ncbi:MAG: helix-turn-helix domain-containing protein [Acidobacteriota bacterium]
MPHDIQQSSNAGLGRMQWTDTGGSLRERVLDYERNLILTALKKTDWNQKRAAQLLKVNPTTLNEKLKRLDITIP